MFVEAQKTRSWKRGLKNLELARSNPPEAPPLARCHRMQGRDVWLWVIDACPYCGHSHTHGGGELAGNPRRLLGERVPHCAGDKTGLPNYILTEALP